MRRLTLLAAIALLPFSVAGEAEELDAQTVIGRYLEARGGVERWRAIDTLEMTGVYAAFSFHEPFRMIGKRGDLYRLDYVVLGKPAIRARDADGPWWLEPLLQPQAARVVEDPYKSQLERESLFGPVLLDPASRGIEVELIGEGEVEGEATVDLRLIFPGDHEEIWHLDGDSWLEVAVDAQIIDFTQGDKPMRRRTFFDDFREVDGLVLPFQVDHEFGARLEAMTVETVRVNPELDDGEFVAPPAPPAESEDEAAAEPTEPAADPGDGPSS